MRHTYLLGLLPNHCHLPPPRLPLQAAAAGGSGKKQRRKSGEGAAGASTSEQQLAGLLQVMHLLANPPAGQGGEGAMEEEEEAGREVEPLEREVVAQVVDALFDRCACMACAGGACTAAWQA